MQTTFTENQLRDPGTARANQILRACVHCGFWGTSWIARVAAFI
jgi:hypothetical protein